MHKANGFTRQEILSTIKLNGSMTADELGKSLGISPVAVRQHLAALEAEGSIATSIERRGLGRPVHRYTITEKGDEQFPRAYDVMANELLEELRFQQGEGAVEALLAARRERLRTSHQVRLEGKPLGGQVTELARIQNGLGYMARTETAGNDYLLIQHNCAICRIARSHPQVCAGELTLFREFLGAATDVERVQHIMAGDHTCTYVVRERGPAVSGD